MVERFAAAAGEWWKYDRYELRGGSIRPVAGAVFEAYDPWARYGAGKRESPWLTLVNLIDQLAPYRRSSLTEPLTPVGKKILLDWCAQYGLLGVLSHETQEARFWPHWSPESSIPGFIGYPDPDAVRQVQVRYSRREGEWVQDHVIVNHYVLQTPDLSHRRSALVEPDELPPVLPGMDSPTGVVGTDLGTGHMIRANLTEAWAPYFPDVPEDERETFRYPLPLTEPFWQLYAEPLHVFLETAEALREAVSVLSEFPGSGEFSDAQIRRVGATWSRLNQRFLTNTSPALTLDDDGWQMQWAGPSLLSHLAMMASLELTRPKAMLKRCVACGEMFSTTWSTAIYCSSTCRYRVQKQRYRNDQLAKQLSATKGERNDG